MLSQLKMTIFGNGFDTRRLFYIRYKQHEDNFLLLILSFDHSLDFLDSPL